jgi:hypothetical protein
MSQLAIWQVHLGKTNYVALDTDAKPVTRELEGLGSLPVLLFPDTKDYKRNINLVLFSLICATSKISVA